MKPKRLSAAKNSLSLSMKPQVSIKKDSSQARVTQSYFYICSGCNKPIKRDKFLLRACDKYWHENCLRCDRCHTRLGELGSTLFYKSNMNLCRQDYLEMFGETGICSVCERLICASEMVMRANENVYHLECFACQICNQRFCVGDRFYLCENKVVCQYDYEEHILPIQRSLFGEQQTISLDTNSSMASSLNQHNLKIVTFSSDQMPLNNDQTDDKQVNLIDLTDIPIKLLSETKLNVIEKNIDIEGKMDTSLEPKNILQVNNKLDREDNEEEDNDVNIAMDTWKSNKFEHVRKPQYIGCIGVKTSMRSLCHRTRSDVAKESIIRLCEANNIPRYSDKKRLEHINRMLDDEPNLLYSGTKVSLCVTSTHLEVVANETQEILFKHEMPNVSFASSGDEDSVDFVAYVAKDSTFGRACFVLELGYETATTVLEAIANAFQQRTKQILYNTGTQTKGNPTYLNGSSNISKTLHSPDSPDALRTSFRSVTNENTSSENVITATRTSLEKEPWYHGSYLSREESETRLKQDGDFLVRESMLDPGHFVLSVVHNGTKLHLLFDSMNQVRTKEMVFDDISHLVKYHHEEGTPIVAENRVVYLRNGVRPILRQ